LVERRQHVRQPIGGNVEVTSVVGVGAGPEQRGSVVNLSRGGALLRVPSPRRRLFKKVDACLQVKDSLTCVLRLPPTYHDIEVFAEVVRVSRPADDPDQLLVGLRFFYDVSRRSHQDRHLQALNRILGVAAESSIETAPGAGQRLARQDSAEEAALRAERKERSARLAAQPDRATRAELDPAASARRKAKKSRRLQVSTDDLEPVGRKRSRRPRQPSSRQGKISDTGELAEARKEELRRAAAESTRRTARKKSKRLRAQTSRLVAPVRDDEAEAKEAPEAPADPARRRRPGTDGSSAAGPPLRRDPEASREIASWARSRLSAPAVYTSLNGPECGLYVRGQGQLQAGRATVELPGHFAELADPATVTVHVTPTADCHGLFVAAKSLTRLTVQELGAGETDATFDWVVFARRRGT